MNESAHDTRQLSPDLVLLAASGLLPEAWADGHCVTGHCVTGHWDTHGAGQAQDSAATTGVAGVALGAGPPAPAEHRSYLPDLVAEACWSAVEVAALLGIKPDAAPRALDWLRRSGVVIGLPRAAGTGYPCFQFDAARGRVHPVVAVVNVWLGTAGDPYTAAVWWLRPALSGLRPRDLVGTPDERRVIDFAADQVSSRVLCAGAGRVPDVGRRVIGGQVAVDAPREHPAAVTESAPVPSDAAASIEPIPRGGGIFGRRPRHA